MAESLVTTCPFCGSIPKLFTDPGRGGHNDCPPFAYVYCPSCYSRGPLVYASQFNNYCDVALVKWNLRAAVILDW